MQTLHVMQELTGSPSPARTLATIRGSARNGRAIETKSASPAASASSASSSEWMRLEASTGTSTADRTARAHGRHAPGEHVRVDWGERQQWPREEVESCPTARHAR